MPSDRPSALVAGLRATAAALALTAAGVASSAPSFVPDNQPTGWVSKPALSSYNISSGNETVYSAVYNAGTWTGELRAHPIDANGNVGNEQVWSVVDAGLLLLANPWDTGRRIVTVKSDGTRVALRWDQLGAAQQTSLGTTTTGPRIVNYIRGDRSNESPAPAALRPRSLLLGDIQHSTLLHWRHADGGRSLFVGSNDGMLHAFDASTGQETFAYVPSMLIPRLARLATDPYVHTSYVDGPLTIGNVALAGASGPSTLLVGGLGAGGRGLFALDVTHSAVATEADAASRIRWEISPASAGFANLGYTYAMPRMVRLSSGQAAVMVGNGYLPANGRASLYLIDAASGALLREIDTGAGSTASPNGLSSPTTYDTDGDGKVDLAYAGDLDGNVWKFDLRAATPAGYTVTKLFTVSPTRSITTAPVVYPHPLGGVMVMFATGRILSEADRTDNGVHHVYGLWDGRPPTNASWLDQTLTEFSLPRANAAALRVRVPSSGLPDWKAGGHIGWRITLPAGERVVGESPLFNDERLYFTSTNPTVAAAGPDLPSGASWLHEINYLTGGAPPKSVFDINEDGRFDSYDKVDGKIVVGKYMGPGVFSQPTVLDMSSRAMTLFASNSDLGLPASGASDRGVSGGHFDVDLYYGPTGGFTKQLHVHEYDDKYDVTGVNFLAPSDAGFKLANAITSTTTPFKVLVMNQYLNPASKLSVGGRAFVSVKDYDNLASATDPATLLVGLPVYTRNSIVSFAWKLPLDAFKTKDWWGDGGARAGLIPTQTGCVNKISNGSTGATSRPGPNGERHDGALTIQLIKPTTPASALELNQPAGGPKYGWRVKAANFSAYVLAEYTMFWHHPNGRCYGDSGWTAAAPEDFESAPSSLTAAAGAQDPDDGSFSSVPTADSGVTLVKVSTVVNGNTTVYTYLYSDGSKKTVSYKINPNGTVTITGDDGSTVTRSIGGDLPPGLQELLNRSRRINWREVTPR